MKLSGDRILLSDVIVKREERQRSEIKTEDLEASISKVGVLQPIIIDRDNVLQIGERRLEASKKLGLPDIPFRYADELTELDSVIIELEENVKRKDLPWQDIVRATARIHKLFKERQPDWTQDETSEALSISKGTCSMYLSIEAELSNERVAAATTVREAFNYLSRKRQRLADEDLEEFLTATKAIISPPPQIHPALLNGAPIPVGPGEIARPLLEEKPAIIPAAESILNESFLEWAPSYSGPKFNLIHCDFPYGLGIDDWKLLGATAFKDGRGYKDDQANFEDLFDCLTTNLDRLMSISGHIMFWYSAEIRLLSLLLDKFREKAPSIIWWKFPLIWHKSDGKGLVGDSQHGPRHIYEACLFGIRSNRLIVHTVDDLYSAPTDTRLHGSAKPEPMLRHFMRMLVDESTSFLDPTCGSGSSLRAAESLGAKSVLGLEIQSELALSARAELRRSRILRLAESQAKAGNKARATLSQLEGL